MCGHAMTPRTAPHAPSPKISRRAWLSISRARREAPSAAVMVAVKTHQANAFLAALDRVPAAVLFYGSDGGLVSERAASLAKRLAERDTPPGEIIRFDDASLDEDPGRIFVELATVPMFCGRKIVRATAGRRVSASQLAPLVAGGTISGCLIVEAG